jgi:hypothetical protein
MVDGVALVAIVPNKNFSLGFDLLIEFLLNSYSMIELSALLDPDSSDTYRTDD